MSINKPYGGPHELPDCLPVFPLEGALLLPRGELPLNIFEPRYLQMIDDVLRTHRLIGMVQPDGSSEDDNERPSLYGCGCVGRLTAFGESGDGRVVLTLTGVARYRIVEELNVDTPYRQCRVDYTPYLKDFDEQEGDDVVDRAGVVATLRNFARAHQLTVDWRSIDTASNDSLVNALAMMSPFGPREKQALLEAADLKARADVLIAIAEIELARRESDSSGLQ
jgi:uncharacterized protein